MARFHVLQGVEEVNHRGWETHKTNKSYASNMVETNVGGRDRLVRAVLAALLTVVAVSMLQKGKRTSGLLALVGAIGFGFNATTCFCGMNKTLGIDTTTDE